ncbi:DUF5133 domain-containing protein [Streptomyces sp. NPDC012623]|uniref:DUF5133 domain-containing protein n=1 Tax=unclassified Streptomyces TaxID=2593676 RepID=UPI0036B2E631
MLEPDPKVLRTLLARYAEARFAHERGGNARTARDLDDVTYTLCVTTATSTIEEAVVAADAVLESAWNGLGHLAASTRVELSA